MCFSVLTEASEWSLNKIEHPVLNELMVRNLYVDNKKRIYLATDSGVYRYSNNKLIKLDERFNESANAFNGPISGIKPFNKQFLIISTFPDSYIFFDTINDAYVSHPFGEFLAGAKYQPIYDVNDGQKIVDLLRINGELFIYNEDNNSVSAINAPKDAKQFSVHQHHKESPLYLLDIAELANEKKSSLATNYQVKLYYKGVNGFKLLNEFVSFHRNHHLFSIGKNTVLASNETVRIFEDQKPIQELNVPTLCEVSYANFAYRDSVNLSWHAMPKGETTIMLISPCGIHEYDLVTHRLQFLYEASAEEFDTWFKGRRAHGHAAHLISTKTDMYLSDRERFVRISGAYRGSQGGTVLSFAKVDNEQYLVADGTPGLYLATNTISTFQTLSQEKLLQLTGGLALRHVIKDEDDNFWLSSQTNGLIHASFEDGSWNKRQHYLQGFHIRSLFEYKDELWVATEGAGLWVLNKTAQDINLLDPLSEYAGALNFKRLKTGGKYTEELLVSTTDGVHLFDLESKQLRKRIDGLDGNVWAMAQDSKDNLWVGSHETGLHKLDRSLNVIETYGAEQLFGSVILDIVIDDNDQPILATWGAGVLYRKLGQKVFSQINAKDGLLSDTVQSILRGKDDRYWVSTERGLATFLLCDHEICDYDLTSYTRADGLPTNLFDLNSANANTDGSLLFGGFFGLAWFDPVKDIRQNPRVPRLHSIDSLLVDGKSMFGQIKSNIDGKLLELPYGINEIRLRFTTGDYISQSKKQYRYKINGGDWIYVNEPEILIPNPSNGSYVVEASSSNSSALWSDELLTISLKVAPPFWMSNLALLLYILLTVAMFIAFHRLKSIRLRQQNKELQQSVRVKTQELKNKNVQLEEAIQLQQQMFENASHDLKTPLSIISSCHEIIKNSGVSASVDEHLRLAIKHSHRLKKIVTRILAKEHKKLFPRSQKIDLFQLILDEISDRQVMLRENKVVISNNIPNNQICNIAIPESDLVIIVGNILDNAIKYSPLGGEVSVYVEQSVSDVLVKITDEGKGLKELNLFGKRYYREDSSLSGSGIGVACVLELVERYNGLLDAKNPEEGGLEVVFKLPLAQSENIGLEGWKAPEVPVSLTSLDKETEENATPSPILPRILYVEDELDMLHIFKQHCSQLLNITHAIDGQHAISLLKSSPIPTLPDVIVSDVMMPNMGGYELCTWIKSSEEYQHIPFLLLTAKGDVASQTQGLNVGADDYVDKFVPTAQIIQKIVNIVKTVKAKERRLASYVSSGNDGALTTATELVDPFVKLVKERFNADFSNSNYTLGDLCNALHKSESTVARNLHKYFGKTFSELLFERRMSHAEKLLITHLQIGEIAEQCGFESFSYFSKRFKERYSMSPSAYRQINKEL
jgi:signal transduction histidine kinase/AraC-like DNA-binding protein